MGQTAGEGLGGGCALFKLKSKFKEQYGKQSQLWGAIPGGWLTNSSPPTPP